MTRPNIMRADTLDLQDHDSPTAAEHAKHPTAKDGNAPHVAAQVHQVLEERHSEEQALADAWNISSSIADDPAAIDQAQSATGTDNVTANGTAQKGEEAGEGGEAEGEADDDMMDRISSSPSIDDGQYTPHSLRTTVPRHIWSTRSLSLSARSTPTSTRDSFNHIADDTPPSSPFWQTPQHLPLRRSNMAGVEHSPLVYQVESCSSPFDEVSQHTHFTPTQGSGLLFDPSKHHQLGRYDQEPHQGPETTFHPGDGQGESPEQESDKEQVKYANEELTTPRLNHGFEISSDPRPIESPFRRHSFFHSLPDLSRPSLEPSPSLTSIQSVDMDGLLLPVDDPLLDMPVSSPTASWESTSETNSAGSDDDADSDDAEDSFIDLDERFIDSGWGGECLRETEDIDFEFVYALHTFVATVEGQANATKGDTMVLLDDSNSYWWLVRVVKDSSIGYLPAEHIETPTERLARLNKHRNIDLSATMLSDNSEKSRNPLKKAMRRRNAKTVQFAAPTYVEASDYDYDTEDEEAQMIDPYANAQQSDATTTDEPDEIEPAEPKGEIKHPEAEGRSSTSSQRASFDREQAATAAQALAAAGVTGDDPSAPKLVDKTGEYERFGVDAGSTPTVSVEAAPLKSKRKNTDSFLKDDGVETRKITLTPGLLRDDSVSRKSSAAAESPRSTTSSMEPMVKTSSPTEQTDKKKDSKDKKEKELKKGGMLSGLFKSKKKDKKNVETSSEKPSIELQRESPSPGPRGALSPVGKDVGGQQNAAAGSLLSSTSTEESRDTSHDSGPGNAFVAELEGSTVAHEMAAGDDDSHELQKRVDVDATPQETVSESEQPEKSKGIISNTLSPVTNAITNMVKTSDDNDKPKKAKRSKQRVELDDFDSPQDEKQDQLDQNPFSDPEDDEHDGERLSESPVEITSHAFMNGTDSVHIPMPSQVEEEEDDSPGSLTSSPSIIEHPAEPAEEETAEHVSEDSDPTPTAQSPQPVEADRKPKIPPNRGLSTDSNESTRLSPPAPVSRQTWSDESFRAWLEDGSEVRDMLVMIHDKTGVTAAPADHPLMTGLFTEQRKGVQTMMGELDGLLGSYLQRKGVRF
ncbi:Tip elongation aberrant protein Tea4 [Fulvia fulva]|nr:Tip elongation aberrant protein Tea4 [Fulvia fulva]WPV11439.1 Tip elongation aberrant protein Tea4 [Fulvia fulva]WPV26267.1 Tip elongation aberrant protein Tea4 [Fulvia fulva]